MTMFQWLLVVGTALVVLVIVAGQLGLLTGKPPSDLGVKGGKLKRPSRTPNCVSSQARLWPDASAAAAAIDPITVPPGTLGSDAMARIQALVASTPGARVVSATPDYIYAQFTTKLLKYVDDTEFWLDSATGPIHVRSASRLGSKDFGANRARIEAIRAQLGKAATP